MTDQQCHQQHDQKGHKVLAIVNREGKARLDKQEVKQSHT